MPSAPEFNFAEKTRLSDYDKAIDLNPSLMNNEQVMEKMKEIGAIAGGIDCKWWTQSDKTKSEAVVCTIKSVDYVAYQNKVIDIKLHPEFNLNDIDFVKLRLLGDTKLGDLSNIHIEHSDPRISSEFPPSAALESVSFEGAERLFSLGELHDPIDEGNLQMTCDIFISKSAEDLKELEANEKVSTDVSVHCVPENFEAKRSMGTLFDIPKTPFNKRLKYIIKK